MYKELKKFKTTNQFHFTTTDDLAIVCNAPEDQPGIFMVYAVDGENKELIMVASTGTIQNDGSLKIKSGGLYDKIVNGHQFAKTSRKYSWISRMKLENIDLIEVVWVATITAKNKTIPTFLEAQMLQNFFEEHQKLPRWNVAF